MFSLGFLSLFAYILLANKEEDVFEKFPPFSLDNKLSVLCSNSFAIQGDLHLFYSSR